MRTLWTRIAILSLIVLGLFAGPGILSARGATPYVPGVKTGDNAVYAQTVGRWNLPGPIDPIFAQFINLNFTTLNVSTVTGSNVTAGQTFFYVNGTVRHDNIQGSVATDAGNITFWFSAANLTTGSPLYTFPGAPIINSSMTMIFAGAPRVINMFNTTFPSNGGTEFVTAWWDRITGILVHIDFAIKTSTGNAFAGAQLVQTNIWSPTPNSGIGLFADPNPLLIAQGFSNQSTMQVLSERGFSGNVTLDASIPTCTNGCPTVLISPATVFVGAGGAGLSFLFVSTTNATGLGSYAIVVHARGFSPNLIAVNMTTVSVNVVSAGADEPPTAFIDWNPLNPAPGQTAFFGSASSHDPDGFIVSFNWTFSDFTQIVVPGNRTFVTHVFANPGLYTVSLVVTDSSGLKGFASVQVSVLNQTDESPVADFFVRVSNSSLPIRAGQPVTFDGSPSFDPDGFITFYSWNFGDGVFGSGQITGHTYNNPGNYTVSLTVTDSSSKTASVQHSITVIPAVMHDVGIVGVDPEPRTVVSGQQVFVRVDLVNLGLQPENVDVIVRFNGQVAASQHFTNVPVTGSFPYPYSVVLTWDTTGVAAGNYTISASVFLANDQNPLNDQFTDGQVTVLPPPVLTATPSQGPVGTKVTLHGSGFVTNNPFQFSLSVEVTFDDQFVGFEQVGNSSSFDFVFNVPVAQAGQHVIHAYVQIFPGPIEASTGFTVVPGPSNASLTVSVGAIYFPGDTVVVYVLSTANGAPASAGSIGLLLLLPNGTSRNLALVSVSTGVYKASFVLPSKNSIGTYGLVVSSQLNGSSTSALGSFEVKPTWLQSNSRTLVTGTAVVGVAGTLGVVALAWRKGFLTRRKEEFPFS